MNPERLKRFGLGLGFVILQIVIFRHLKIFGMHPDLVLIFLLWFVSKETRTMAIIMAALLGFCQDALLDLWGLNMFAKTLVIFMGYNIISHSVKRHISLPQTIAVVFIAALVHNLIFLAISGLVKDYATGLMFWQQLIGNSAYTAILAGLIQLFRT